MSVDLSEGRVACVFGASGGIGAALVRQLAARDDVALVHAGARAQSLDRVPMAAKVRPFAFDLHDDDGLAAVAADIGGPLDLVIVATGALTFADGAGPEKGYRGLDAGRMAALFALNTIGPAMIARHFLPLLPRDRRAVFTALSARVGSIADNRLGGWHSYRASKAALNMLMRNFAIELGRTHRQAIIASLHPGTVDTGLSQPFQRNLPPGQLATPDDSAAALLSVIDGLRPQDSGGFFAWDGKSIEY